MWFMRGRNVIFQYYLDEPGALKERQTTDHRYFFGSQPERPYINQLAACWTPGAACN
jgi:hypothetical protein